MGPARRGRSRHPQGLLERLLAVGTCLGLALLVSLSLLPVGPATGPSAASSLPTLGARGTVPLYSRMGSASTANWTNVSGALYGQPPVDRCCSSMVYDAKDGYTVLFGGSSVCKVGCNRTFVEEGSTWVELPAGPSPSPREWAAMTFDPFDGEVLLFGGLSLNGSAALSDTWAFSGGNWTLLQETSAPPPRWAAGMTADLQDGYVVLFGGYSPSGGFLQDTWGFVNGTWEEIFPATSPPARWTPAMTYDPELGSVLLFWGFSGTLGFLGDSWTYRSGVWTQLAPSRSPPDREKAMMTYDAADQAMVLFGGDICPVGCGNGLPTRFYNDTWTFSGGNWTNVTGATAPPPQCCGALSYAWNTAEVILLAQNRSTNGGATTWLMTLSSPPPRAPEIKAFVVAPFQPTTTVPTTFLVEARPSSGALSYSYQGLPPGCRSQNISMLSCTVTAAGTYTIQVTVSDGTGRSTQLSTTVDVSWGTRPPSPSPPPPNLWPEFLAVGLIGAAIIVTAGFLRWRKAPHNPRAPPRNSEEALSGSASPAASAEKEESEEEGPDLQGKEPPVAGEEDNAPLL